MITLFYIFLFFFLSLCGFLSFLILIQESKSMGLGVAFGGESSDSIFGTSTASVLKKLTANLAAIFLILSLALSLCTSSMGRKQAKQDVEISEFSEDSIYD